MPEELRIEPAAAQARVDAGDAIVLDVVSPMAWEQIDRAVRGAVHISPDEIDARWSELPRGRDIVAYCT